MVKLDIIQEYERYIQDLILTNEIIEPQEILIKLLIKLLSQSTEAYGQAFFKTDSSKLSSSTLKRKLHKNFLLVEDFIQTLNNHIKDCPLQKEDELQILLIIFFKYYQHIFYIPDVKLKEFSEFYQYVALPGHTYNQICMENYIEILLKNSSNYDKWFIIQMLSQIDIPHGKIKKVTAWLALHINFIIDKLYDAYYSPDRLNRYIRVLDCINKLPIKSIEMIVYALIMKLSNKKGLVSSMACCALKSIKIPAHMAEMFMDALLIMFSDESYNSFKVCSILMNIEIPEHKHNIVVDALLLKLNDENYLCGDECEALGSLKIPDHQLDTVIDALIKKLNIDATLNFQKENICKLLGSLKIHEHKLDVVIDALLSELNNSDGIIFPFQMMACKILCSLKIPAYKLDAVIDPLFKALSDKDIGDQEGILEALGSLNLPEHKLDTVLDNALANLSDFYLRKTAYKTFGYLSIPEHKLDTLLDAILIKLADKKPYIIEAACNALISLEIPEHKLGTALDTLLKMISGNGRSAIKKLLCRTLASLKIPKNKIHTLIDALLVMLRDKKFSIQKETCMALSKLNISEEKLDTVIDALLEKSSSRDTGVQKEACIALGKLNIPEDKIDAAVDVLLGKISSSRDTNIQEAACKALSGFNIQEAKLSPVLDILLEKLSNESTDAQIVKTCMVLGYLPLDDAEIEKTQKITLRLFALYCARNNETRLAIMNILLGNTSLLNKIHYKQFIAGFCHHLKKMILSTYKYTNSSNSDIDTGDIFIDFLCQIPLILQRLPMQSRLSADVYVIAFLEKLSLEHPQHIALNAALLYFKSHPAFNYTKEKIFHAKEIPLEIQEKISEFSL